MRSVPVVLVCLVLVLPSTSPAQPMAFSVQSNGDDHLYQIDLATGMATDLGAVGINDAEGLASVGTQLFAIGGTLEELWDITTPPGTMVGSTGPRSGIDAGLAYDVTTATMYNLNGSSGTSYLYTIDITTGMATQVGTGSAFSDGLAISQSGLAFATDFIFMDGLYSVDLTTGAMTFIGPFGTGNVSLQAGAAFDATGTLWALTNDGQIWNIDPATGAAMIVGSTLAAGWEGLEIIVQTGPPQYQVNQLGSSLDVNGVTGTQFMPASVSLAVNQQGVLTLSSTNSGLPWDMAFGQAPLIPVAQGALMLSDGQIINVDFTDPALGFWFNVFQGPPFANVQVPFSVPAPATASLQMANIDPGSPTGVRLSQATRIVVQ